MVSNDGHPLILLGATTWGNLSLIHLADWIIDIGVAGRSIFGEWTTGTIYWCFKIYNLRIDIISSDLQSDLQSEDRESKFDSKENHFRLRKPFLVPYEASPVKSWDPLGWYPESGWAIICAIRWRAADFFRSHYSHSGSMRLIWGGR